MPTLTSPPPTEIHTVKPIPTSTAQSLLATFIAKTLTDPSLHPDAQLTPEGPQFAGNNAQGGVTLTQLRRFEMGLRGERVGGADEAAELQQEKEEEAEGEAKNELYEGAEDMDTYMREQEDDESEAEDGPGGGTGGMAKSEGKMGAGAERVGGNAGGGVDVEVVKTAGDKDAKKKDKKARRKAEQKERAEKRRKVE